MAFSILAATFIMNSSANAIIGAFTSNAVLIYVGTFDAVLGLILQDDSGTMNPLLKMGLLFLDENTQTYTVSDIPAEVAQKAGITPTELAAFNSNQNLAIATAVFNGALDSQAKQNLTLEQTHKLFIDNLKTQISPEAFSAYSKLVATLKK